MEFSLPEVPLLVSLAAPLPTVGENPIEDHLAEIMRQRQMLDLDQSGQKAESITFPELLWDGELFGDEWLDFTEPETSDFWSGVFEEELLVL